MGTRENEIELINSIVSTVVLVDEFRNVYRTIIVHTRAMVIFNRYDNVIITYPHVFIETFNDSGPRARLIVSVW